MTAGVMAAGWLLWAAAGAAFAGAMPPEFAPDPDPVQGLHALMERHGHKPYDLFERDGELASHRVIFHDRVHGTSVWMLDDAPTAETAGTASVWPAWDDRGTAIYLPGTRLLGGRSHAGWFMHAGFSRLRPAQGPRPAVWDPGEPDWYYAPNSLHDHVARYHWHSGEREVLAEWGAVEWRDTGHRSSIVMRLYGMTSDRRHLFIDIPNRGLFVPFENDPDAPIPQLNLYDGRPLGPGGRSVGHNHVAVVYGHEEHGDLIALRTGMLIDRETGATEYLAAPLCGHEHTLRAFEEGRVRYPRGEEWKDYGLPMFAAAPVRLPEGLTREELHALWLNLPHATHGHESMSPDGQFIATDGRTTLIYRVRDGSGRGLRLSPDGSNYHLHWRQHPRYFAAWVRGWRFGRYTRSRNANIIYQVFCDATAQPIVDTKHRFDGTYGSADFSMLSADATKVHYGSTMTGRSRNYIAVLARPRPPPALSWRATDEAIELSWRLPALRRELRGTLVYRSETSGADYRLLTPEPIAGTRWTDASAVPGRVYHYVVTALEYSGLESGYSPEAARAVIGRPQDPLPPLVLYLEAGQPLLDLPSGAAPGLALGVDRKGASDGYYVYRHPEAERGSIEVAVDLPAGEAYYLWARVRSATPEATAWTVRGKDWQRTVAIPDETWTWVRAGEDPLRLEAGRLDLALATRDPEAQLDLLCLATDPAFIPQGPRPECRTPPPAPEGLRAANVRERVNVLSWDPVDNPGLAHYQVYASRTVDLEPGRDTLIGSPTREEFIDWGLRAGTRYHYAVTAVDRRGNESAPARVAQATPPAPAEPVHIELAFGQAALAGPFERLEAGGTRAAEAVVPEDPGRNRAAWDIEIPRAGTYYLWLRSLARGTGTRGDAVRERVRVRVDGKEIALLGGRGDLSVPDAMLARDHPLAPRLWTWSRPGLHNLEGVSLPAGTFTLELDNLAGRVRYDVLVITDDPAYFPRDGRMRH